MIVLSEKQKEYAQKKFKMLSENPCVIPAKGESLQTANNYHFFAMGFLANIEMIYEMFDDEEEEVRCE